MNQTQTVRAEFCPGVYRSRYGFHPCDYQTFLLVRRLFKAYMRAVHGFHVWRRWSRKEPQNQVVRRTIRDDQGRKIGSEIVGPRAEPLLCPVFVERKKFKIGGLLLKGRLAPHDHGILACRHLCRPVATPQEVIPLPLTVAQMEEMLARLVQ